MIHSCSAQLLSYCGAYVPEDLVYICNKSDDNFITLVNSK